MTAKKRSNKTSSTVENKALAPASAKRQFQQRLSQWYRRYGRDLPWRRTTDPYAILVS
jgi:A/G-specific adenine glycosylase